MSSYGITPENLLRTLPEALQRDERMLALATGIAVKLAARPSEVENLKVFVNIDTLPEELLDILARDFKVDWYDPDLPLDEKRQVLKDSWIVHKTFGTKGAIERALSAIYPGSVVREWFKYAADPYHFKILIDETYGEDVSKLQKVLDRVQFYKNVRSHFDGVEYIVIIGYGTSYGGAGAVGMGIKFTVEVSVDGLG